jgi:hypothetical protein
MAIQMWSRTNGDDGIGVAVSPDSQAFGNEYWKKNISPIERKDTSGLLGRLTLTMKKMLLLTAINERSEGITPEMMERSFSILPYLIKSAGVSGENLGETKEDEIIRAIRDAFVKEDKANPGKGITANRIRKIYNRHKFQLSDVNKALENMVKIGELEKMESQRGPGRPTIRYRIAQ